MIFCPSSREVTISVGDGEPGDDEIDVVALGPPMLGVGIRLVDERGVTVDEPLRCGEVVVSGSSVAAGTIGADGTVVPFPADGVRTGDIGFVEGGDLFVVERTKNVVIRHGHNYSSAVLERTLAGLAGVSEHNVLVLDLDLAGGTGLTGVVAVEPGADPELVLDAVVRGLDRFELPPERLVTVARGALPRTTSGKKRHVAAREMLRTGALATTAFRELWGTGGPVPADHVGLARQVLGLVAEHVRRRGLDVPVVPASRFLADLAFDSLALLDLAVSTEARFGITVREADLAELHTVEDLVALADRARRGPVAGPGVTATLAAVEGPLPRTYTPDEWLPVEFRVIGEELTAVAEGKVLGTVRDTRIATGGGAVLFGQNCSFRDIVYIPLDDPIPAQEPMAK